MTKKLPFEKTNMCSGKLRCRAENQDQQKECKYYIESQGDLTLGRCLLLSSYSFITGRCCSPEANSEALEKLINAVKEQL